MRLGGTRGSGESGLYGAKSFFRTAFVAALAGCALAAARAEDAPQPRQIAPDRFAPTPRDAATLAAPHPIVPNPPAPSPPGAASAPPAGAPIVAPTRERPFGACDRTARDWLICIAATALLSDGAVAQTEARLIASLDRRPSLNPVMRQAIAKALAGAGEAWRSLRERECADLAMIESGLNGGLYEVRLVCRIRRNLERVQDLSTRYGEQP
jgi:hypothetical protein